MSALAVADWVGAETAGPNHLELVGAERTLDDLIVGAWEALSTHRSIACPVCDGELMPVWDETGRAVGGCCGACGAELS